MILWGLHTSNVPCLLSICRNVPCNSAVATSWNCTEKANEYFFVTLSIDKKPITIPQSQAIMAHHFKRGAYYYRLDVSNHPEGLP